MHKAAAPLFLAALAACNQQANAPLPGETATPAVSAAPAPMPSAPAAVAATTAAPLPVAAPTPSASRDPQAVLIEWARAVSLRDWTLARAYWGDHGERSGLSEQAFAARWGKLADPQVDIGKGSQEGAAGSLYYTAPITIRDGKRTIKGEVVIRRVNDVDGATPEQLRWHIESTTLAI
ncbi:hypothetical protein ACOYW6_10110 [Parablastomonas sp. CN1-191]|uniref:hypothetical protein n=1 Tax=Parablastomonas sp. CN1-191 TaxID=3400908 RepID=UPI003BF8E25A